MRVVMLCQYPLTKMWGGPAVYIDHLSRHISQIKDFNLHVVTIGEEERLIKKENFNIHVIKVPKPLRLPIFIPIVALLLIRKIIKINPTIVHAAQGTLPPYSVSVTLVKDKYATILTILGIVQKEMKNETNIVNRFSGFFNQIIEKYVIYKTPNIIVEAPSIKDLISEKTNSKIYVVPAGIEYEEYNKKQYMLDEGPDIFYLGRLSKTKGIDVLIKAVPLVIQSVSNLKVYIAGSGPQEKMLKALVKKLDLENHIKFLGFISKEDKYRYYKVCKVVVIPSRWDCQPITLFEAAASGKPVIASDMSNPGIVKDGTTGFIFKSENIQDLANKMIILLKNEKLREKMGKSAKEKAKQYDWSVIAERFVKIYKEVIIDFQKPKAKNS